MRRVPPIILGLAVSGALALIGWGAYAFAFSYVRAEWEKLSVLEGDLAHASQKEAVLTSVKSIVADTAPERMTIEGFFVGREGVVSFLELVEEAGKRAGVETEVTSVSLDRSTDPTASFENLRVSVRGDGKFSNVFAFFIMIEELPFGVRMQQASVAERTESGATGWRASLTFTVPKLK